MNKGNKTMKWTCCICRESFKTKRSLCEDLAIHFEEASMDADEAIGQLEELGVKDHTKFL